MSRHTGSVRTLPPGPARPVFAAAASLDVLQHVEAELDPRSLLSPAELARWSALARPRDREDFLAARVLTRLLLVSLGSTGAGPARLGDVALSQQCSRCGGPHGRPTVDLPGTAVSWAHSHGFVAAAAGPVRVGVDVEPAHGRPGHLPAAATVRSWVRSEAVVKWGHGDVDEAVAWQSGLQGRDSGRGRRYAVGSDGSPRRARPSVIRRGGEAFVLTDAPTDEHEFVCSVAAPAPALWVDVLRP